MKESNFRISFALLCAGIVLLLSLPGKAQDDINVPSSTDSVSEEMSAVEEGATEEEVPTTIVNPDSTELSEDEDLIEE
ncbi:MAG: hypothetical protein KC493_17610 [Bacteriovoracaceae bacterium]|nr:hypothetical protein [Bacteriovoracaceae bacterium]